jgi:hypothetical protein
MTGFIGLFDTACDCTLQFAITQTNVNRHVFNSHCLVAASNGGRFPSPGFPNCPRPPLQASHSKSSQQLYPSGCLDNYNSKSKSESKLCYDRRSVGQYVLVSSRIRGPSPDFCYCQTVASCWCGAPSLAGERVCRLQLLLALASAIIFRSEFRETHDHILLSQIWNFANLEDWVPMFISPRNRVTQLYRQALGSLFVTSYDSQGYGGGIRTRLHGSVTH